jgi:hypothetical protein
MKPLIFRLAGGTGSDTHHPKAMGSFLLDALVKPSLLQIAALASPRPLHGTVGEFLHRGAISPPKPPFPRDFFRKSSRVRKANSDLQAPYKVFSKFAD